MKDLISQIQTNINKYPDTTVIVDQGENDYFTYRSFDAYARKIASKLSRMGITRRDFVTIELPRSKEYIAAMYAVWMVGAAFAPLSPDYPEERLAFIRGNCGAKAVINTRFLRGAENEEPLREPVIPDPADPSLLIYTSGSTGKPKGVLHSHASITDSVNRYIDFLKTPAGIHAALGAPFTFVASVQSIFAPLCECITAYLMPSETMRDPVLLAEDSSNRGADALLLMDQSRGDEEHDLSLTQMRQMARLSDIPMWGAGNISRPEDVKKILYAGCRKAVLNAAKPSNLDMLEEVVEEVV